jgi:acyl carrier protein
MKCIHAVVRDVLARHARQGRRTGMDTHDIRAYHDLKRDLGLTPLELVVLMLEVEERVETELPVEELAQVETVGDLFLFVVRAVAEGRRAVRYARRPRLKDAAWRWAGESPSWSKPSVG